MRKIKVMVVLCYSDGFTILFVTITIYRHLAAYCFYRNIQNAMSCFKYPNSLIQAIIINHIIHCCQIFYNNII